MRVDVAAIAHFDPLCGDRLRTWLRTQLNSQSSPPAFVAVEWDKDMFTKVKSQRPVVRSLAASRWPQATDEFLNALEAAVAFEADTHVPLIPHVPTVWLDQDRALPYPDAIETYAVDRITVYASYIPPSTTRFDSSLLHAMSLEAWNRLGPRQEGGTERDPGFAEAIAKHLTSHAPAWSIAIVGANHASRDAGYMVQRLEAAGISCEVSQLRPHLDAA